MKCIVEGCLTEALIQGRCRRHQIDYKLSVWQDNTNLNDFTRGFFGFVKDLLAGFAYNAFAEGHKTMVQTFLELYDPFYRNKMERLRNIIAFRGSAKSTLVNTLLSIYVIAMNGKQIKLSIDKKVKTFEIRENLIIIISETEDFSENFTTRIRDQFIDNDWLKWYFPAEIDSKTVSETATMQKTLFRINGVWVLGRGVKQQIRGLVRDIGRPSLIFADDIYSERNIGDNTRKKINAWWDSAVVNTLDDIKGKLMLLGTILHEDTVNVSAKHSQVWETIEIPVMPIGLFREFRDKHILDENKNLRKFYTEIKDKRERMLMRRAYFDKVQAEKDWKLSWAERVDLYELYLKYVELEEKGKSASLYQEYFHIVIPDEAKKWRKEMVVRMENYRLFHVYGYNWVEGDELGPEPLPINLELGIDPSGSENINDTDPCAFVMAGRLADGRVIIFPPQSGKFAIRDILYSPHLNRGEKVILDNTLIEQKGMCDEAFRYYLQYKISRVKIGASAEENNYQGEIERLFNVNGIYEVEIMTRNQSSIHGKKYERIYNTLLPLYQPMVVIHAGPASKFATLEGQLEFLRGTKHDDEADATEIACFDLMPAFDMEYKTVMSKSKRRNLRDWKYFATGLK